jgi:hypothetical protein
MLGKHPRGPSFEDSKAIWLVRGSRSAYNPFHRFQENLKSA